MLTLRAVDTTWDAGMPGVMTFPSGRMVRGRGLRKPLPPGPRPDFALHLAGKAPADTEWEARWLRWPDFLLPTDRKLARTLIIEAWERAAFQRVEVACGGGRGRTGTVLACMAVLEGLRGLDAVRFVRANYDKRAVETPWQRRYVLRFVDTDS